MLDTYRNLRQASVWDRQFAEFDARRCAGLRRGRLGLRFPAPRLTRLKIRRTLTTYQDRGRHAVDQAGEGSIGPDEGKHDGGHHP